MFHANGFHANITTLHVGNTPPSSYLLLMCSPPSPVISVKVVPIKFKYSTRRHHEIVSEYSPGYLGCGEDWDNKGQEMYWDGLFRG